ELTPDYLTGACVLVTKTSDEKQWRTNGEDQWRGPMARTDGEDQWRGPMARTNGEDQWLKTNGLKPMEKPNGEEEEKTSGLENEKWAVIHPVMIAIQINVHGQESIESVIPKTLNTFIESQSNLQCDIRQQYKSAVLRNHWSQIQ
ncbi:hypothetical protein BLOT_011817, partial [Blomia tropicalis]